MKKYWLKLLAVLFFVGCDKGSGPTSSSGEHSPASGSGGMVTTLGDNQCGGRFIQGNPYKCCSNGGNCTWWAWYAGSLVWGTLPTDHTWGNAAKWADNAPADGYTVHRDKPAIHTIAVNTSSLGNLGHVAWVIDCLPGNRIRVTQMFCDVGNGGVLDGEYSVSHFDAGFIYPKGYLTGPGSWAVKPCPAPPPPSGQPPSPVPAPLTITTPPSVPLGAVGVPYALSFQAIGGTPPYTWAPTGFSTFPPGTTFSPGGTLNGTPTTTGNYLFRLRVTDTETRTAEKDFILTIHPAGTPGPAPTPPGGSPPPSPPGGPGPGPTPPPDPSVPRIATTSPLPSGTVGVLYYVAFQATDGKPPYSWALADGMGNIPTGVSFPTTGILSGTPTQAGTFNFRVQAQDARNQIVKKDFSATISPGPTPPPTPPPPPPPTVSGFSPTSGPPGTAVSVSGTNFVGVQSVFFSQSPGFAAHFVVQSSTALTAYAPDGQGSGRINVRTPSGTAPSSGSFTITVPAGPVITGFSPTSGPVNTEVTISGANFNEVNAITFTGTPVTQLTAPTTPTVIKAKVPFGATTGPIRVVTKAGTAQSAANFTVTP